MGDSRPESGRRSDEEIILYWYATLVVLTHAAVVPWHLEPLARLGAALKVDQVPLFAGVANIVP